MIQLVFHEKGALYAAYVPILINGGIFVPTTRKYALGDDLYKLLSLPDSPQRYPVAGKVAWITPANAAGGRTQGVAVSFPNDACLRRRSKNCWARRCSRPSRRRRSDDCTAPAHIARLVP